MASLVNAPDDISEPPNVTQDVDMDDNRSQTSSTHGPKEEEEEGMDADEGLFGDDEEVEYVKHDHESGRASASPSAGDEDTDGLTIEQRLEKQRLEYAEDDDEEPNQLAQQQPLLEAAVSVPNIPVPKPSDGQHWILRLPNFLKIDAKPFNPDTYEGPEEELAKGSRDRDMLVKLRVENTVRWRWTKDAEDRDVRQSNARVIRWSDGTSSLRLGKEYFDMSSVSEAASGSKPHALTYLVAQHKSAGIMQAEAAIAGHISLRPTDMASETHRLLARAVGQKHSKTSRLRLAQSNMDADHALKEQTKATKRPRRSRADGESAPRRRRQPRRQMDDMYSDDDEEDDAAAYGGSDDDHRSRKRGAPEEHGRGGEYQTDDFVVADESDEDADASHGRKKRSRRDKGDDDPDDLDLLEAKAEAASRQAKKTADQEGDEDAEGEDEDANMDIESEEEDEVRVRRHGGGRKTRRVFDDDEEDE
ncbi:Leo1-domain-containing protein [Peniophora sp. CONT]|nr:Leo1-domain-containing protein [Peniophora sp. CONT]